MFRGVFFKRILMLYIVSLCVYTVIMVTFYLRSNSSVLNEQAELRNNQIIETVKTRADDKLLNLISLSNQIASSNEVVTFASTQDNARYGYQTLLATTTIKKILTIFSSPNIEISAINEHFHLAANHTVSIPTEEYLDSLGLDGAAFEQELHALPSNYINGINATLYGSTVGQNANEKALLYITKKVGGVTVPLYVLINRSYLIEDYGLLGDGALYCSYNGETLFTYGNDEDPNQEPSYTAQSSIFPQITFTLRPYRYQFIKNNLPFILVNILWGLALLLLTASFISYFFKKLYRPLGEVIHEMKEYGHDSSENEKVILKNNITTMKSQAQQLNSMILANSMYQRERILKDILYGAVEEKDINRLAQTYSLEYLHDGIIFAIVEFTDFNSIKNLKENLNEYEIKEEILNYIKSGSSFRNKREIFELGSNRFLILTAGYEPDEFQIKLLNELGYIESFYGIVLNYTINRVCQALSELKAAYFDALSALDQKASSQSEQTEFYYPFEVERTLIEYVQQGDPKKVNLLIESIIHRNFLLPDSTNRINDLLLAMTMTLKRLGGAMLSPVGSANKLYIPALTASDTEQTFVSEFQKSFTQIIQCSESTNIKKERSLTQEIVAFIQENYQRDLSLAYLAQHFNISIGYIGKLLRENMNTTFREYLNRYRIDVAKQVIIDNPQMKFIEVAQMCGFTNITTFNRVFKSLELITPSEYRNQLT